MRVYPIAMGTLVVVHEDERRIIREFSAGALPHSVTVEHFEFKENPNPGGKHAHRNKFEVFTVLHGSGKVLLCPVDDNGAKVGEIISLAVSQWSVFHVPPYMGHTTYFTHGSIILCVSSMPFDPGDVIPCPWLVLPENIVPPRQAAG